MSLAGRLTHIVKRQSNSQQVTVLVVVCCKVFTAIFVMEAALKIMALGLFRYLKDRWNCFDLFVVSLSLIELGLSGNKSFSILRSFRLVRNFVVVI